MAFARDVVQVTSKEHSESVLHPLYVSKTRVNGKHIISYASQAAKPNSVPNERSMCNNQLQVRLLGLSQAGRGGLASPSVHVRRESVTIGRG